jgi:hypothetical protein
MVSLMHISLMPKCQEPEPASQVQDKPVDPPKCPAEIIRCDCGRAIGEIATIDHEDYLLVGGILLVKSIHSVCRQCGKQFHWTMSDRILERIIKKYVLH